MGPMDSETWGHLTPRDATRIAALEAENARLLPIVQEVAKDLFRMRSDWDELFCQYCMAREADPDVRPVVVVHRKNCLHTQAKAALLAASPGQENNGE